MNNGDTIALVLKVRDGEAIREFRLDAAPGRTVLDLLETLRAGIDSGIAAGAPTGGVAARAVPAYRHSCHHGSCGTCGAVINGIESLLCLTRVSELAAPRARAVGGPAVEAERDGAGAVIVALEPLSKMSVVSGIAVVPGPVFAGLPSDAAYLRFEEDGGRSALPPDPEGARVAASAWRPSGRVRFEACIECGLCVSACPVAVPFIGPASLAAVNREREKRPDRALAMLALAAEPDGVGPCGRHLACSRACPQAVYPGKHIQLLRNALADGGR